MPPIANMGQATAQLVSQFEITERHEIQKTNDPVDEFGLRRYYGSVTTGTSTKMAPDLLISVTEEVLKKLKIKF